MLCVSLRSVLGTERTLVLCFLFICNAHFASNLSHFHIKVFLLFDFYGDPTSLSLSCETVKSCPFINKIFLIISNAFWDIIRLTSVEIWNFGNESLPFNFYSVLARVVWEIANSFYKTALFHRPQYPNKQIIFKCINIFKIWNIIIRLMLHGGNLGFCSLARIFRLLGYRGRW